ncbi:MAG TPA: hypothetical protein VFW85_04675 [Gaiellaceae bacterium]|nr:hypothetical protein [Gaiellaceae bacterium]
MSHECFTVKHYGELLDAASSYRFAQFDHEPAKGDLFLRHDVDMSLEAALEMAELERERGVTATYFLMTRSDFYNLDGRVGQRAIERLRELGHAVGLHGLYPDATLDARFDPVFAWHTPEQEWMSKPVEGAVNVMQEPWFDATHYRSDSNRHWRSGCPVDELRAGAFEWLQLLVHPEIWVFDGATMREKMLAYLDADQRNRFDYFAANRLDLS